MLNIVCGREIGVADWCLPVGVGAETRKKCLREKEQNGGDREQKWRDRAILFKFSITSIKKFNYFFFDIVDT